MDQAIEKYEEELARIRKARALLAAGPDRRHRRNQNSQNGNGQSGETKESIGELLMDALREDVPPDGEANTSVGYGER